LTALLGGGYVALFAAHLVVVLGLVVWRLRELGGLWRPAQSLLAAGAGIALLAAGLRMAQPVAPQVYFDEFYYLATARNVRTSGTVVALIERGLPPAPDPRPAPEPPYPQGWPTLLSLVSGGGYGAAVGLQRSIGVLTAVATFAMLAPESLVAAAFAGGAVAVMPALLRLSQGASAEGASLLFVVLALWGCRSQRFRTGMAGALLAGALVALAGHFRPENMLYAVLFLPLAFFRTDASRAQVAAGVFAWLLFAAPDVLIMAAGATGPAASDHFEAVPRPGFATVAENFVANLIGNLKFLVDGAVLPFWASLLALLGGVLLWDRGCRLPAAFYAGWIGLFILALSPFPFGDFQTAHSYDTWRFSLQVTLPVILLGARGLELAPDWARRPLPLVLLAVLMGAAPLLHGAFITRVHPLAPAWQGIDKLADIARAGIVVTSDERIALLLREGYGVRATLGPSTTEMPAGWKVFFLEEDGRVPPGWSKLPLALRATTGPLILGGIPGRENATTRLALYEYNR